MNMTSGAPYGCNPYSWPISGQTFDPADPGNFQIDPEPDFDLRGIAVAETKPERNYCPWGNPLYKRSPY